MADQTPKLSELDTLVSLKSMLDDKFGKGIWKDLEPETMLMEFHTEFSVLLFDKLMLLKILEEDPNSFLDSPVFFLEGVEVANNQVADFEVVPHPNSLQLAWALDQFFKIMAMNDNSFVPSEGLIKTVGYLLREDGFSEAVAPFGFLPKEDLCKGTNAEDMKNKATAVKAYINHMLSKRK